MRCFIVLPCFNEEKNLKSLVSSLNEALSDHVHYEIIAVNDGSHDRTSDVLRDLSCDFPLKVVEHKVNMGLGPALRSGLMAAVGEADDGDFIVTMDSDNTHDPVHVLDMLASADSADVIVGSRYVKGGAQLNVPPHRVFLSRIVNFIIGSLFQLRLKDNTSGFRCFRASLLKRAIATFDRRIIESRGFVSSLELLLKVLHSGGVAAEVPIVLDYGKKGGRSKLRLTPTVLGYLSLFLNYAVMNRLKRWNS